MRNCLWSKALTVCRIKSKFDTLLPPAYHALMSVCNLQVQMLLLHGPCHKLLTPFQGRSSPSSPSKPMHNSPSSVQFQHLMLGPVTAGAITPMLLLEQMLGQLLLQVLAQWQVNLAQAMG